MIVEGGDGSGHLIVKRGERRMERKGSKGRREEEEGRKKQKRKQT